MRFDAMAIAMAIAFIIGTIVTAALAVWAIRAVAGFFMLLFVAVQCA